MKAAFGLRADFFFAVFFATTVSSGTTRKSVAWRVPRNRFSPMRIQDLSIADLRI